jgi:hypothetical protein
VAGAVNVPVLLILQTGREDAGLLAALLEPGSAPRVSTGGWPDPPEGTLVAHWPRGFPWTPQGLEFLRAVQARGGRAVPLGELLRRTGGGSARGLPDLLAALAPGSAEVEDPRTLASLLVTGLAGRLAAVTAEPAREVYTPRPEVQADLEALPSGPGVYRFLAADGSVLYVGKAAALDRRVRSHFRGDSAEPEKSRALAVRARRLRTEPTGSELEALLAEHLEISACRPPLNTQTTVHPRPRGAWRRARVLAALPSHAQGHVEACLITGEGRFHWERVPRRCALPRGLWGRVRGLLERGEPGWAPGRPGVPLRESQARDLAEIALSWLARRGSGVSRIDLATEVVGKPLMARIRALLGEDPVRERIEVR